MPYFYRIREDLSIDLDDVEAKLQVRAAAIVIINYFGFSGITEKLRSICEASGTFIIEDCAHSFFLTNPLQLTGERSSAAIYSFKKLLPSMVGGAFSLTASPAAHAFEPLPVPSADTVINCKRMLEQAVENMHDMSRIKRSFLAVERLRVRWKHRQLGIHQPSHNVARVLEFDYPFDERLAASRIPWYARHVLRSSDLGAIASARRRNYLFWLHNLPRQEGLQPVYDYLPERIVPWAFPVLVESRSEIDLKLRKAGIPVFTFGETLHAALTEQKSDAALIGSSRYLSVHMLCLPVHQQVSLETLASYCSTIGSTLKSTTADRSII